MLPTTVGAGTDPWPDPRSRRAGLAMRHRAPAVLHAWRPPAPARPDSARARLALSRIHRLRPPAPASDHLPLVQEGRACLRPPTRPAGRRC